MCVCVCVCVPPDCECDALTTRPRYLRIDMTKELALLKAQQKLTDFADYSLQNCNETNERSSTEMLNIGTL